MTADRTDPLADEAHQALDRLIAHGVDPADAAVRILTERTAALTASLEEARGRLTDTDGAGDE